MKISRVDALRHITKQLTSLGFTNVVEAKRADDGGVALISDHIVAQVGLGNAPVGQAEVQALHEAAQTCQRLGAYYSASGYADDAEAHAKLDGIALFDLGARGRIRPSNRIAKQLVRRKHSPELAVQSVGTDARDREPDSESLADTATVDEWRPETDEKSKEHRKTKWLATQMSTAVIQTLVALLVAGLVAGGVALYRHLSTNSWSSTERGSMTISREGYRLRGMSWPFTADSGVLTCHQHQTITFTADGSTFALMSVQDGDRAQADKEDWQLADAVLNRESEFVVIGLSNVIADGQQLC